MKYFTRCINFNSNNIYLDTKRFKDTQIEYTTLMQETIENIILEYSAYTKGYILHRRTVRHFVDSTILFDGINKYYHHIILIKRGKI